MPVDRLVVIGVIEGIITVAVTGVLTGVVVVMVAVVLIVTGLSSIVGGRVVTVAVVKAGIAIEVVMEEV